MAFYGCDFVFNGTACSELGLMVYSFVSSNQGDVTFQTGELVEDKLATRSESLTYGLIQNGSLEYTLVFGANIQSLDANSHIDRFEVDEIVTWLTGYSERKWLSIVQDDMDTFRYKCYISDLKLITYGDMPWAFSCTVNCDSPFAYLLPEEYDFSITGNSTISLFNGSSCRKPYKPEMTVKILSGDGCSFENLTSGLPKMEFAGLSALAPITIKIDNKNQVITCDNDDINIYKYFNLHFLGLLRGDNAIKIIGNAHVSFTCEFPVNIGG